MIAFGRRPLRLQLIVLAIVGAALGSCGSSGDAPIVRVFKSPPWQGTERYTYDLVDQGGRTNGTCELHTTPGKDPGTTLLEHLCANANGDRDDRSVVVESPSLKPLEGSRTIFDVKKNKRTTFRSTYTGDTVKLTADENGDVRTASRDLPQPTKDSPEPGYYDDESLFWVVRGIPLEKGYEGSYKDLNASNGRIFTASLRVEKLEAVDVPAGAFRAWKVRLETNSITQYFWVDEAAPHPVVKASIESVSYRLTARE